MCRRIGVTGTREGANSTQILSVIQFLESIEQPAELHHGDCKGVDEEVAVAAGELGFKVICHPPEDDYLRAFHKSDEFRKPAGYFERDRAIVDSTDLLIVVPLQNTWQTRGGTWYTCSYAKKTCKPYVIFFPNGTVETGNMPEDG